MTTLTALDIGYRGVKALATNGRTAHFPSVVGTERKSTYSLAGVKKDSMVLTFEGQTWYVGGTALRQGEYSSGHRDPQWIFSKPYRVLMYAALSELHRRTTTTSVVTGLPLEDYTALVNKARGVFMKAHTFERNDRKQTVTIENALIVTQPYGSLLDLAMADTGKILDNPFATGVVGIADIGGVTLNLLVADNLEEIGRWTQGDGLGLLKALDAIAEDIKADCPGFSPKAREVAEWLVQGQFPYKGKNLDIVPYAKPHLEPLVEAILGRMSEVWMEPGRYSAVVLTGGGSVVLGPMLKEQMNGVYANVTIAQDAVFANVRGYLKLARRIWETDG